MKVETIKIKSDNDQGFVIINKSDKTEKQTEFTVVAKTATARNGRRK